MVAEALGLEVVYDGSGVIVATDPATLAEAATGIAGSGADLVWVTIDPTSFGGIYGQALAAGFSGALWSGAGPSWNPPWSPRLPDRRATGQRLLCLGVLRALGCGVTGQPDGSRSRRRGRCAALDYYAEGVIEATILHQALLAAHEAGDMTQAGVLAAAKSLESVTFDGLAPDETYVGEPNDRLQRAQFISRPDPAGLAGGTSTGSPWWSRSTRPRPPRPSSSLEPASPSSRTDMVVVGGLPDRPPRDRLRRAERVSRGESRGGLQRRRPGPARHLPPGPRRQDRGPARHQRRARPPLFVPSPVSSTCMRVT